MQCDPSDNGETDDTRAKTPSAPRERSQSSSRSEVDTEYWKSDEVNSMESEIDECIARASEEGKGRAEECRHGILPLSRHDRIGSLSSVAQACQGSCSRSRGHG